MPSIEETPVKWGGFNLRGQAAVGPFCVGTSEKPLLTPMIT
jgi:hypothetical protein